MSKYELKAEDNKRIARGEREDVIIKFMKRQEEFRFNIGDVLVKQVKGWSKDEEGEKWVTEEVSHITTTPKKFMYVHENAYGVGYVKQIKSDGKLNGVIYAMTEFDPESIRFQLDPDYADHIMLSDEGEEFDFHAAYRHKKKFREAAYKNNKKLLVPLDTRLEQIIFANTLNVGDRLWSAGSMDDMVKSQYEVTSVKKIDMTTIRDQYEQKKWLDECERFPGLSDYMAVEFEVMCIANIEGGYAQNGKTYKWKASDLRRYTCIKPPAPMSEDTI